MVKFLSYLKNPIYKEAYIRPTFLEFISYIFIYFIAIIPIGVILFLVARGTGFENKQSILTFQEKIFYGILFAPFVEELLFRLILRINKKNLIILNISVLVLLIFFIIKREPTRIVFYSLLTICLSICLIYIKQCKSLFIKYFNIIFYIIAGLFGLLHIYNYLGINLSNFILTPLFAIPQFVLGLILGYIRVNNGFIYAVLFHFLMNLSLLVS